MNTKLLVTGIIGACLIGGCFLIDPFDPCDNEVKEEIFSPDGSRKAVVFSRNCGATTGFNRQVSILSSANTLPNESGNVFVTDEISISVKWLSNTHLNIAYTQSAKPFYQINDFDDVTITYRD